MNAGCWIFLHLNWPHTLFWDPTWQTFIFGNVAAGIHSSPCNPEKQAVQTLTKYRTDLKIRMGQLLLPERWVFDGIVQKEKVNSWRILSSQWAVRWWGLEVRLRRYSMNKVLYERVKVWRVSIWFHPQVNFNVFWKILTYSVCHRKRLSRMSNGMHSGFWHRCFFREKQRLSDL